MGAAFRECVARSRSSLGTLPVEPSQARVRGGHGVRGTAKQCGIVWTWVYGEAGLLFFLPLPPGFLKTPRNSFTWGPASSPLECWVPHSSQEPSTCDSLMLAAEVEWRCPGLGVSRSESRPRPEALGITVEVPRPLHAWFPLQ